MLTWEKLADMQKPLDYRTLRSPYSDITHDYPDICGINKWAGKGKPVSIHIPHYPGSRYGKKHSRKFARRYKYNRFYFKKRY